MQIHGRDTNKGAVEIIHSYFNMKLSSIQLKKGIDKKTGSGALRPMSTESARGLIIPESELRADRIVRTILYNSGSYLL
jgi:hypothetical protein